MRKVFKPENIVKEDRTVKIPDLEFKNTISAETESKEETNALTEEVYNKMLEKVLNENSGRIGRQKLRAAHDRDVIIHNAKLEAQKILSEAEEEKNSILEEARAAAEQIKTDAYDEGLKKGISEKSELIENLSQYLSHSIEKLKQDEIEYFEEYARQLKYIAIEIAEKIIYQKISEDDMTMYNLVKNAVRSVRDVSWVKAEVSEQLAGYADSLEKELCESGQNVEISINEDAPIDECIVNTPEGIIVASVSAQLENLKDYINRQDKGEENEIQP